MKIKPTSNWRLISNVAELDTQQEYEARWATNQPEWQEERKLFTDYPDPIGFLLKQGEYVITEVDRPVDLDRVESLLRQWLETADLFADDAAMTKLIAQTKKCLSDLQQSTEQSNHDSAGKI